MTALTVPVDDGLVQALEAVELKAWEDLFCAAPLQARRRGVRHIPMWGSVVTIMPPHDILAFNRAIGVGAGRPATGEQLRRIVEVYRQAGLRRLMLPLSPAFRPAGLPALLEALRFVPYNNWVKLSRDASPPPPVACDLRIERLGGTQGPAFAALVGTVFDWPDTIRHLIAETVGRPGWVHVGAFDGDRLVAAGGMFQWGNLAWMGPAATLPEVRGRGAQSALIAARVHGGIAGGVTTFAVETAEPTPGKDVGSIRNLQRQGFTPAYLRPNWVRTL